MKAIDNPNITMFDCDDTLLIRVPDDYTPGEFGPKSFELESNGVKLKYISSQRHIDALKQHKLQGHTVFVWSHAGDDWCRRVVQALGIEQHIDYIMSKPKWYWDDQDWNMWTVRMY